MNISVDIWASDSVVSLSVDRLSPLTRERLRRLSTVAGACLEHNREYAKLEGRFHQIADRNRELSQFARTVAHDLNSPLSVIYGRIELSLAEPPMPTYICRPHRTPLNGSTR